MATTLDSHYWDAVAGDRSYDALDRAHQYAAVATDGYVPGVGDECAVEPSTVESMTVRFMTGRLWVQGRLVLNDSSPVPETADDADATNKRIDTFVVRLDPSGRVAETDIVKGTPATVPAAPTLTQTVDDEWEHPVADLHIPAGATQIYATQGEAPAGQGWIVPRGVAAGSPLAPSEFSQAFRFQPASNTDLVAAPYVQWGIFQTDVDFPSWATKALVSFHAEGAFAITNTLDHALRISVGGAVAVGGRRVRAAPSTTTTLDFSITREVTLPTPGGTHNVALQGGRVSGTGALRATDETVVMLIVEPRR